MNDKVRLFSFFLYFLHICYLSDCEDVDLFTCRTADDVNNLNIERVFLIDNKVFIILKDKFISLPMPICYQKVDYASNRIKCSIGQLYTAKATFKYPNSQEYRFKGYFLRERLTYAIYENIATNKITAHFIASNTLNELTKGEEMNEISEFKSNKFSLYNLNSQSFEFSLISFNETDKLYVQFKNQNRPFKITTVLKEYSLNELMTYYQTIEQSTGNHSRTLFLIDNNAKKVQISLFRFVKNQFKISYFTINFDEFFNCRSRLEIEYDLSKVKGIFFSNDTFFLLIRRSYVEIKENFLDSNFRLTDRHYDNVKELTANNYLKPLLFDIEMPVYIKTIQTKTYLVCFDEVYKLTYEDQNLNLKTVNDMDLLKECPFSTVKLDKFIFCFTPDNYYAISKNNVPIKSSKLNEYNQLFKDTEFNYSDDIRIYVVFSILDQKFVFFYSHGSFIINYNRTKVIEEADHVSLTIGKN